MLKYEDFLLRCPWKLGSQSEYLYCQRRKKWLLITPEEQVRQYALYVLEELGYSMSRVAVERSFMYLSRPRRLDILAYDKSMSPFLLVECKRADLMIQEENLRQLLRYNAYWNAPHLALFNGHSCYCLKYTNSESLSRTDHFPSLLDAQQIE